MSSNPTDTVYGLGVSVRDCKTPACLFNIKQRSEQKPIAWLVEGPKSLQIYGAGVPAYAMQLSNKFWPGPLTLVVNASLNVPLAYANKNGTIGLRMPANSVAQNLIRKLGCPIATTSANISGNKSVKSHSQLDDCLLQKVSVALCDGKDKEKSGIASTVVLCTGLQPKVLRQGEIFI